MTTPPMKEPKVPPTHQTQHARVWEPLRSDFPQHCATLAAAVLHVPASHPVWPWKVCSVITLADIEGLPPANKMRPEMTHELLVLSINPEADLSAVPATAKGVLRLEPPDIIHQFVGSDHDARELHSYVISGMLSGALIPDTDWRTHWAQTLFVRTRGLTAGVELPVDFRRHELH